MLLHDFVVNPYIQLLTEVEVKNCFSIYHTDKKKLAKNIPKYVRKLNS